MAAAAVSAATAPGGANGIRTEAASQRPAATTRMRSAARREARGVARRLGALGGPVGELFANPRRLAGTVAQVVELGAPDIAAALHLDACEER